MRTIVSPLGLLDFVLLVLLSESLALNNPRGENNAMGISVVSADSTATAIIFRRSSIGINDSVVLNDSAITCSDKDINDDYTYGLEKHHEHTEHRCEADDGKANNTTALHASMNSAPPLLCLRSINARSWVYLRTLRRRRRHPYRENIETSECSARNHDDNACDEYKSLRCCWYAIRNTTTTLSRSSWPVDRNGRILPPSSVSELDTSRAATTTAASSGSTMVRVKKKDSSSSNNNNNTLGPRLLSRKMDILFATRKVQNNEIQLPQSIAEIFQQNTATFHFKIGLPENAGLRLSFGTKSNPMSLSSEPSSSLSSSSPPSSSSAIAAALPTSILSLSQPTFPRLSQADPRVDLTGRWRPVGPMSTADLNDYNAFLKACCSNEISYWTRQLLTSSSVVSRQELVVEQSDRGRVIKLVDIHPLSSEVWNRTVVTSTRHSGGKNRERNTAIVDSATTVTGRDAEFDSYQPHTNRLKDPQDNPILVEAFWQKYGTVHSMISRKIVDGDGETDDNDYDGTNKATTAMGWLHTNMYLLNEYNHSDADWEDPEDKTRVMVVETTYHWASFPSAAEMALLTRFERISASNINYHGEGAATRMVWKWERVSKASR